MLHTPNHTLNNQVNPLANSIWNDWQLEQWIETLNASSFIQACDNKTITRSALDHFTAQHYLYAKHFTRFLCAALSHVDIEEERLALVENLFEEMGADKPEAITHAAMFREMLGNLDIIIEHEAVAKETQDLIEAMYSTCRQGFLPAMAALCLGAEAIVPHLYGKVIEGYQSVGVPSQKLAFYKVHVEDDEEHALVMERILRRTVSENPEAKKEILETAGEIVKYRQKFLNAALEVGKEVH